MFNCELCGKPIEAGICEVCLSELGLELYSERVENAQNNFFAEWCVETDDSDVEQELVENVTRQLMEAILSGKTAKEYAFKVQTTFPMEVGVLESTPCPKCGRWSTGLCCN